MDSNTQIRYVYVDVETYCNMDSFHLIRGTKNVSLQFPIKTRLIIPIIQLFMMIAPR